MELKCAVQSYDWGKRGINSIVADLKKSANPDFVIDEQKPYAELWMGTHENGPSYLKNTGVSLHKHIQGNIKLNNGKQELQESDSSLPFLFKVLSINKALSIQVHPDKEKAKELHKLYPDIYKDPNHKPELAIALTPFEAFCGFRPIDEIIKYMKELPELRAAVGEHNAHLLFEANDSTTVNALRECFYTLMTCNSTVMTCYVTQLIDKLEKADDASRKWLNADLLQRLHMDYPGDVGCFAPFLLNYITMQQGEAMYIAPNVPHAYLSGDCIECMACSDNVIRAGLTPKRRDVPTLIQTLSFDCLSSSDRKLLPHREDACTDVFRPPVPEFAVAKITIPFGQQFYKLISRSSASILIIVNGEAKISSKTFCRGSVLFIPTNEEVKLEISCHPTLIFQAFTNI